MFWYKNTLMLFVTSVNKLITKQQEAFYYKGTFSSIP